MVENLQSNTENLDKYANYSEYCRIEAGKLSLKLAGANEGYNELDSVESKVIDN